MMKTFRKGVLALFGILVLCAALTTGCHKKEPGPMEQLGKQADKALEEGQKSINSAIDEAQKAAQDAVEHNKE